jgi:hypothetical protein
MNGNVQMASGVAKDASRQMERRKALQEQSRILEAFYTHTMTPLVFPDHPIWGVTYRDWTLVPLCDTNGEAAIDSQRGGGTRVAAPPLTAETGTAG